MKIYNLDIHGPNCKTLEENLKLPIYWDCADHPYFFLFFLKNEFFLLRLPGCNHDINNYEYKVDIIKAIINKNEIFDLFHVQYSVDVKRDLLDLRLRNKSFKKTVRHINYVYENAAGKKFAITTRTNYLDAICDQSIIKKNYIKAKQYLIENNYPEYILNELEELYEVNRILDIDDIQYCRTVDHLIKSINNLINESDGKS